MRGFAAVPINAEWVAPRPLSTFHTALAMAFQTNPQGNSSFPDLAENLPVDAHT